MRGFLAVGPIWVLALVLLSMPVGLLSVPAHAQSPDANVNAARLAGDRERTRFIADLSKKVDVHIFALGNPYRVIVDAADVSFQMPSGLGKERRGLVSAYRYGLFAPGKSRIVIDINNPFLIDRFFVIEARDDQPARLVIDLVPTNEATFLAKLREAKKKRAESGPAPSSQPPVRAAHAKPIIVIDPGHGGIDPGTSSVSGVTEKEVVLKFAERLKQKLAATGRYEIHLTRQDDTFWPLKERVAFAQKKGAGLFLSIHADYFPVEIDGDARGATIFTLSEQASDAEAKALAAKENFSDAIAGIELPNDSDEVVANILIDLAQRETQNRSLIFARSLVGELANKNTLHTKQLRSAGFRVLKAPDVPSVLLELGFLSNPDDEKQLTSEAWRDRMTDSVAAAIDGYFAKRIARMPF
ncbi:MAG: N-acetylmuramoyl-L-alanine amidase [Hyphomicrobiaceae bacterium]|nr:N-acetylmuramoyl-L-alanine amidase [Hyphomicrobiaceae bacterium]MDX2450726.1 N-acetylmuramoyl-L-alanine amidase [Hyphomicrobiaceae bacterium]